LSTINTVIFDLGAVLIDWNPRYLYRKIFKSEEEINWFLENICTGEWNDELDAGRSFKDATDELATKFPEYQLAIRAWHERWPEMMGESIKETVQLLKDIKDSKKYKIYALTNWSAETFPFALKKFEFLHWFDGIVVSGVEKSRKPFPEFYQIMFNRYQINPTQAIFIDDNPKNVAGALQVGLPTIHFQDAIQARKELSKLQLV
jgi:2-haloacid dehalogenase